jgi:hypothetical protein
MGWVAKAKGGFSLPTTPPATPFGHECTGASGKIAALVRAMVEGGEPDCDRVCDGELRFCDDTTATAVDRLLCCQCWSRLALTLHIPVLQEYDWTVAAPAEFGSGAIYMSVSSLARWVAWHMQGAGPPRRGKGGITGPCGIVRGSRHAWNAAAERLAAASICCMTWLKPGQPLPAARCQHSANWTILHYRKCCK